MLKSLYICVLSAVTLISCSKSPGEFAYSDYSFDFELSDSTESHAYISHKPNLEKYPLILFLQGAGCGTVEHIHTSSRRYFSDSNAAILTIDKPGAYHDWRQVISMIHCSKEFQSKNYPSKRASAIVETLKELRNAHPIWNGQLYVVAAHEGAYAAALVAKQWDIQGLVILGTGEGFSDAKAFSDVAECLKSKKLDCNPYQNSTEILKAAMEGSTYPKINYRGISGTGQWWKELLSQKLSDLLDGYKGPTLVIHTGNDSTIEQESAKRLVENMNKSGNKNVELKIYEDLDGGFIDRETKSQKHQVQLDISAWIMDKMKK